MNPLKLLDGYKTYLSIAAYTIYLIAEHHGLAPIPDLEIALKSAIGASFAHKVAKLAPGAEAQAPPAPTAVGPTSLPPQS